MSIIDSGFGNECSLTGLENSADMADPVAVPSRADAVARQAK